MNQNQPDNATEPRSVDQQQACSLLVDCTEDKQHSRPASPQQTACLEVATSGIGTSASMRLEPDEVHLSTQEGHVSTLRAATITIEQLTR